MKTIIFINTSKSGSSYDAIKFAANMQYYTVLLTNSETFINKRNTFPHVHLMECCDIDNIDETKDAISQLIESGLNVQAIVSFVDPYCYTAAILAQEFGLKHSSAEAISIMQDKVKSREILLNSPYVPFFYKIDGSEVLEKKAIKAKLPLVLKVPSSAGSKDVYRVKTYKQYEKTKDEIREKYPDECILVEEYLEGPQYLIETVTINNKVYIVAIIEQEITFTGRFIITGYKMILDHENEFYQSMKEAVNAIIKKHGMTNGPCHLEIRYVNNEWKLIEANPRVSGGAINSFVETAYGISLVGETLKFALGLKPNFEYKYKKETFLQYVIVRKKGVLAKVTGRTRALNCEGVEHVYIRPKKGSIIVPATSMAHRYAYVIATGQTADEAEERAKYGASQIKFHLKKI